MILYAYRCGCCGYEYEEWFPVGLAPQWAACPVCMARMQPVSLMRRIFTKVIRSFIDIPPKPPKGQSIVDRIRRMTR